MGVDIIRRRIQKLGGSSLIITLPKSWAKKLGLDVGDTVVVVDEGDYLKIFPPDSRMIQIAETIRFKLPQSITEVGLTPIIECLYLKGYKRFIIQVSQGNYQEIAKLVEEARSHPKVKDVFIGYNEIMATFNGVEAESPTRFIRHYNSKIQELVEVIENSSTANVKPETIDRIVNEAVDIARTIGRALRKHGLTICEAESVDPSISAPLIMVPQILKQIYLEATSIGELPKESMSKIRTALLETFGGLAGRSGRRLANSIKLAEELKAEAEKLSENRKLAKMGGIVLGLSLVIRTIGESTLCEGISKE
ncbi:MAG: AbrB/MazE/SpoVT family DNA-binding domain-containing protein [Thermoprotei archaeon]|nr:AbrB/MazE/SpoVT family DNA-binding domain-containing protein [Thermoprotei archaeon]